LNPFWNAKATNEGEWADFADLTPELVVMATSVDRSEKNGQISNLQPNTYHIENIW